MKKLLFAVLVTVSLMTTAFAAPVKKVNHSIVTAFQSNYPRITNVSWDLGGDHATATFVVDNIRTQAFYDLNGNFIGASQAIAIDNLPVTAKRSFAKKYGSYTVNEAIQFDTNEETVYYISAENDKESVILKVAAGTIETFKKTNKK